MCVRQDGAVWTARHAHNVEVVGSNPTPATSLTAVEERQIMTAEEIIGKATDVLDKVLRVEDQILNRRPRVQSTLDELVRIADAAAGSTDGHPIETSVLGRVASIVRKARAIVGS